MFVRVSGDLRRLRRKVPISIARHGTPNALEVLTGLASDEPENLDLKYQLGILHPTVNDRRQSPVADVRTLLRLVEGPQRLVNDQYQLRDVVIESLLRFQDRLAAANGWAVMLWNRNQDAADKWWPCWENDFSDFVATFLRYDLADRKVVINREIELTRPRLAGSRTDIQIQAQAAQGPSGPHPLTAVIECKGCWNSGLRTDLANQLVERYLTAPNQAGIYLVAYFDDNGRWRKDNRSSHSHAIDQLRADLSEIAAEQERSRPVSVLNCRLPASPTPT